MKRTFNVFALCGAIFAFVGIPFSVIGVVFAFNMPYLELHGEGDVWILPVIFIAMGSLTTAIGVFLLWIAMKERKKKKQLIQAGNYVMAKIVGVVEDWSIRINHRPCHRVICVCEDQFSGKKYEFRGEAMMIDPAFYPVGATVKVYVDKNDWSNYLVICGKLY